MKKWILISSLSLGLCYSVSAVAFSEKNVEVYSQAMNKNIPVTIVLPEGYASSNKYSTIYCVIKVSSGSDVDVESSKMNIKIPT
ncbi:hypothetical protein ACMXY9_07770 [Pasteurella multocida]|uniref:hypothetical protein n=1 Tax=Pasteurella multocida TaxID=747 RepID=UPI003CF0A659